MPNEVNNNSQVQGVTPSSAPSLSFDSNLQLNIQRISQLLDKSNKSSNNIESLITKQTIDSARISENIKNSLDQQFRALNDLSKNFSESLIVDKRILETLNGLKDGSLQSQTSPTTTEKNNYQDESSPQIFPEKSREPSRESLEANQATAKSKEKISFNLDSIVGWLSLSRTDRLESKKKDTVDKKVKEKEDKEQNKNILQKLGIIGKNTEQDDSLFSKILGGSGFSNLLGAVGPLAAITAKFVAIGAAAAVATVAIDELVKQYQKMFKDFNDISDHRHENNIRINEMQEKLKKQMEDRLARRAKEIDPERRAEIDKYIETNKTDRSRLALDKIQNSVVGSLSTEEQSYFTSKIKQLEDMINASDLREKDAKKTKTATAIDTAINTITAIDDTKASLWSSETGPREFDSRTRSDILHSVGKFLSDPRANPKNPEVQSSFDPILIPSINIRNMDTSQREYKRLFEDELQVGPASDRASWEILQQATDDANNFEKSMIDEHKKANDNKISKDNLNEIKYQSYRRFMSNVRNSIIKSRKRNMEPLTPRANTDQLLEAPAYNLYSYEQVLPSSNERNFEFLNHPAPLLDYSRQANQNTDTDIHSSSNRHLINVLDRLDASLRNMSSTTVNTVLSPPAGAYGPRNTPFSGQSR